MARPAHLVRGLQAWKDRHKVETAKTNQDRIRKSRNALGHVALRFHPQILCRRSQDDPVGYQQSGGRGGLTWLYLLGEAIQVRVPEAVDVAAFFADLRRFIKGWRPARTRSPENQVRVEQWWQVWDRSGGS